MSNARNLSNFKPSASGLVEANDLASGVAVSNIGYTPVNKAGDTMTGNLSINGAAFGSTSSWGAYITPKSGGTSGDFLVTDPTGGNIRLSIDSAGRVTMPYQPAFNAWGSTSQSWSGAQNTQILQINNQSSLGARSTGYNTSTYTFTAPIAGTYVFLGKITQTNSATGPVAFFYKNGAQIGQETTIDYYTAYLSTSGFQIIQLAQSDTVDFRVANYNSTSFTLDLSRCSFAGWLLG